MIQNYWKQIFLFLAFLVFVPVFTLSLRSFQKAESIESPVSIGVGKEVLFAKSYFWQPKADKLYEAKIEKPLISAQAAIVYDLTGDRLLFEKNSRKRYPIASLTKVMTALVALDAQNPDARIRIGKDAAKIGENSMGLEEGEELSLYDLLHGLMLVSGNDAAEAIAQASSVGRDNFVFLMNKKAEYLGLSDTHFTNPTGLEGDGNQYSSAYDLLVITKIALENKIFSEVVSTVEYAIPQTQINKEYYLQNETNLLTSYPGVKGVKTGFTDEAGLCLITYLEHGEHKIIGVLLNSSNRRDEMRDLLDYSLKALGATPPPRS